MKAGDITKHPDRWECPDCGSTAVRRNHTFFTGGLTHMAEHPFQCLTCEEQKIELMDTKIGRVYRPQQAEVYRHDR